MIRYKIIEAAISDLWPPDYSGDLPFTSIIHPKSPSIKFLAPLFPDLAQNNVIDLYLKRKPLCSPCGRHYTQKGLHLNDPFLPIHLNFTQELVRVSSIAYPALYILRRPSIVIVDAALQNTFRIIIQCVGFDEIVLGIFPTPELTSFSSESESKLADATKPFEQFKMPYRNFVQTLSLILFLPCLALIQSK